MAQPGLGGVGVMFRVTANGRGATVLIAERAEVERELVAERAEGRIAPPSAQSVSPVERVRYAFD